MTIALIPTGMIMMGRVKKSKGTPVELTTMSLMSILGKTMGMIGGIGLLITGGALVGIENYKWFSFSEFPWLAYKQTVFVIILIINFTLVVPPSKKLEGMIAERMTMGGGATDKMRAIFGKIGMAAMLMNILTLIAMTFGVTKGIF